MHTLITHHSCVFSRQVRLKIAACVCASSIIFDPFFVCRFMCLPSKCAIVCHSRGLPTECTHSSHTILACSLGRCGLKCLLVCVHHRSSLTRFLSAGSCAFPARVPLFVTHVGCLPNAHTHHTPFLRVISPGAFENCCLCVCIIDHL